MVHHHHHRAGLFLTARLLLCAAMSLIIVSQVTGFATDDPPPEEIPVTESTDLDGDHQSDAITAAPAGEDAEEPDPGEVYMSSSEGGDVTIRGGENDDWFGAAVADVGDLNNDGFRDLLVGAPRENNGEGRAYLFYGPFRDYENPNLNIADADMIFRSPDASDYNFGVSVRAVADIDCDGRPDIGIGGLNDDGQGNEITIAYIASGANGGPVYRIVGDNPFDTWHEQDGDAEGDGDVDQADMAIVGGNIGRTGPTLTRRDGDFDGDADVDGTDYAQVMANFGADHFSSVRGCNPGCPPPANIPPGFHCIERCSADSIVAPINVWSECDPIMCPTDCSCTFQIFPAPPVWQPAYEVPRETEVIVMVDPHSNGAAAWQILEGAERIQLLETTPTYLRFNTLTFGPVHITATYDCCMGWCPLDIPLFITCGSMPEPWLDTDYDQIIDGVECEMGLNPNFSDSDGDTMPDNWEIQNGFDPLDPSDGTQDDDDDGVPNFLEYLYGSDPFNGASGADPAMDADGDGYIDWLEDVRGSDKFDPNSVPQVNFSSGDMAWAAINGVIHNLNSEMIEMCVGDLFRLHATGYASSWAVLQGQSRVTLTDPDTTSSCYSGRWRIDAPGDIVIASATGYGAHTTLGYLHIRARPANECDQPCPITIAPCGGGSLPDVVMIGQQICLNASGAGDQPGDYQWTVLENATFAGGGQSAAGSQVTLEITGPGEVAVSVKRGECEGKINLTGLKIKLKSVKFGGALHQITRDGAGPFIGVHWLDANLDGDADDQPEDHRYPVAMTRGSPWTVQEVRFVIEPADVQIPTPLQVTGFHEIVLFSDDTPTIQNGELIATDMVSGAFDSITCMEDFPIDWGVHLGDDVIGGGVSKNTIYATLANPQGPSPYWTVIHRACKHAVGQTTAQGAVNGIWGYFQGMVVQNYKDQPAGGFGYWRDPDWDCDFAGCLITGFDGKCGAWADFMRDVLRVHGLDAKVAKIIPDAAALGPPAPPPGATPAGFRVKNWTTTQPYSDLEGIPAQGGVANPNSAFQDHGLVEWSGQFYDPSYGRGPYSSVLAWQRASLDIVEFWTNGVGSQLWPTTNSDAAWPSYTTIQHYVP